jgi:folylpolyglutamate synthase
MPTLLITKKRNRYCARRGTGRGRTGLYTSPHLIDVRERIRIDGKAVAKEFFAEQFWVVWDKLAAARSEKFPSLPPFFRYFMFMV